MSVEGQLGFFNYHKNDKGTQFNDISRLLEMSESAGPEFRDKANQLKSQISFILDESRRGEGELYREIVAAKNKALEATLKQTQSIFTLPDSLNAEFTSLMQLFKILGSEHASLYINTFFRLIDEAIKKEKILIQKEGKHLPNILIADEVASIKPDDSNFDEVYERIKSTYGDTGLFFFFSRCIKEGKGFSKTSQGGEPKIISYLQSVSEYHKTRNLKLTPGAKDIKADFEYRSNERAFLFWNYRNLLRYAQTKQLLDSVHNQDGYVISLSGGVSNGISQIGLVKKLIEEGKTIKLITGYSIGAIIGTLLSLIITGDTQQDIASLTRLEMMMQSSLQDTEGKYGPKGQVYRLHGNALGTQEERDQIRIFFSLLGNTYGLNDSTTFQDPKIKVPLLVGATRKYGGFATRVVGEQEMVLGGSDTVMNSVMASANLQGKFGKFTVDGYEAQDYAENESGLMLPFNLLGIPYEKQIAVDVGYSSNSYNNLSTMFSRALRGNYSLWRDLIGKEMIAQKGGLVYNVDSTASQNQGGFLFSKEVTKKLLQIGYTTLPGNEHRFGSYASGLGAAVYDIGNGLVSSLLKTIRISSVGDKTTIRV